MKPFRNTAPGMFRRVTSVIHTIGIGEVVIDSTVGPFAHLHSDNIVALEGGQAALRLPRPEGVMA